MSRINDKTDITFTPKINVFQVPCPRDCEVGEWSEWGACQPTDGCPLFPVQQLTTTGRSFYSFLSEIFVK